MDIKLSADRGTVFTPFLETVSDSAVIAGQLYWTPGQFSDKQADNT